MAYEIGFVNAAGSEGLAHRQMLLKIKTFAEAQGWVTLRYDTSGPIRELILRGVGLSGTDQIFVGFRAYHDVGADYYNLSAAGFIGYVSGNAFDEQPGYFESGIPAHNTRIDYWLAVNAQRIAFGLKVGTPVYEHGYAGKFLPYASPSQFPYPLVVGGMLDGIPPTRFSDSAHSMYAKGSRQNFKMRFVDGTWRAIDTWPWWNSSLASEVASPAAANEGHLRPTGTNYSLLPVMLTAEPGSGVSPYVATPDIFGELDGVYYISGFNNAVENTLLIGGKTYVVMQDVSRTGFPDYYALEMS